MTPDELKKFASKMTKLGVDFEDTSAEPVKKEEPKKEEPKKESKEEQLQALLAQMLAQ